jgi:membrane-bound inhibitor of C-type lysozyme
MKSNKLIAFMCSAAIAVTSVSGIITVSAANDSESSISIAAVEKGYQVVFDSAKSTATEKYIDVKYVGYDSVKSGAISFDVPEEIAANIQKVEFVPGAMQSVILTDLDIIKSKYFLGGSFAVATPVTADDGVLFTFKITLTSDITSDWVLNAQSDATIEDASGEYLYEEDEFGIDGDTVLPWVDPNATEPPTPTPTPIVNVRPTLKPVETADPNVTEAPTQKPVEKGYELIFDSAKSTSTAKYIDVKYVGYDVVKSGAISFDVPAEIAANIEKVEFVAGAMQSVILTDLDIIKSKYFLGGSFAVATPVTADDGVLFTFVITLSADIDSDWTLNAQSDATIEDASGEYLYDESEFEIGVDTVTPWVDPNAPDDSTDTETQAPLTGDATVEIKKLVGTPEPTVDGNKLAGVYVDVTKADGTPVYGTDYQAFLGDTPLTEEEFEFVKAGYTSDGTAEVSDVQADIINKLVIKAVNGVTVAAGPAYATADGKLTTPVDTVKSEAITSATPTATATATAEPTETETTAPTAAPTATPSGNGTASGGHSSSTIASGSTGTTSTGNGGVVTSTVNFQDLSSVPWAVTAINSLASLGVINGRSETVFDPNATVTRAEFAKMVCNAFGITTNTNNTQTFTDVTVSDWFYQSVEAAAAAGVINGISDTEFAPNELVTREQMAAMLYRAIAYKGISLKTGSPISFTDASSISEYAVTAVNALSSAGVINGMDDGSFAPKESATRAQAACIIYQYFASFAG